MTVAPPLSLSRVKGILSQKHDHASSDKWTKKARVPEGISSDQKKLV
jgi:hypothetical protein